MSHVYDALKRLPTNAVLRETVSLNSGIQLAAWYNKHDTITGKSNHHTSLYVADGYRKLSKLDGRTAVGRTVLSDAGRERIDVGYSATTCRLCTSTAPMNTCADVGKKIWDKRPLSLTLDEAYSAATRKSPPFIASFCSAATAAARQPAQHLSTPPRCADPFAAALFQRAVEAAGRDGRVVPALCCCATSSPLSREKRRSPRRWPNWRAGRLSEYHFARMFRQSMGWHRIST